jgi:prepilin-type N-terminal cleavage/methylation domain-containing protein
MKRSQIQQSGFTLIELLVVISIISLISSVILASLNTARAKARDAAILADVKTLATALELYYDDHGEYPAANNYSGNCCQSYAFTQIKGDDTDPFFISELAPYLKQLPNPGTYVDPYFSKGSMSGSGPFSRIMYNRPWLKDNVTELTGIQCDPTDWSPAKNCYVLTIRTETNTQLGPAETRIYLINGSIPVVGNFTDPNWTFINTWGFW